MVSLCHTPLKLRITDCQRPHEDGHLDEANQSRVTGFDFRGTSDPGEYGTNEAVSSFNQEQCNKAFEVAIALISKTSTTPSDLVMITPCRGNLEYFECSQYQGQGYASHCQYRHQHYWLFSGP